MVINLGQVKETFEGGPWDVAIKKYIHGIEGGVGLDVTGWEDKYIYTGHGVIKEEGVYKPQPIDGTKEDLLIGVVASTTRTAVPSAGVMTVGVINNAAVKYPFTDKALAVLQREGIQNQED
ncbi:hypothetical protein ACFSTE_15805 [Aquimarina hainanensis]|uniref:Uncharacterized protein n=1 Tax=Aquimarina hainanensis TaxID=1578017 RepID=A0ABW5NAG2_9FLAO